MNIRKVIITTNILKMKILILILYFCCSSVVALADTNFKNEYNCILQRDSGENNINTSLKILKKYDDGFTIFSFENSDKDEIKVFGKMYDDDKLFGILYDKVDFTVIVGHFINLKKKTYNEVMFSVEENMPFPITGTQSKYIVENLYSVSPKQNADTLVNLTKEELSREKVIFEYNDNNILKLLNESNVLFVFKHLCE